MREILSSSDVPLSQRGLGVRPTQIFQTSSLRVVKFDEAEQRWRQFRKGFKRGEQGWEQMSDSERREALTLVVERVEMVGNAVRAYIPPKQTPPSGGSSKLKSGNHLAEGLGFELRVGGLTPLQPLSRRPFSTTQATFRL